MSTLVDYRGLQVVSPDLTGEGGLAIQNDLKDLVDWHPKSVWAQTADPTASDDESADFFPGSLWLRTNVSPPKLFVCRSNSTGAAVWDPVLLQVQQDTAPKLGGNLDVNGTEITSSANGDIVLKPNGTGKTVLQGNVGAGETAPETSLHVKGAANATLGQVKIQTLGNFGGLSIFTSGTNVASRHWAIQTNYGTHGTFEILRGNAQGANPTVAAMRFDRDGKASIGTALPHTQFQVSGPIATAFRTVTAADNVTETDSVIAVNAASAAFTLTLPTAVGIAGRQYAIKRINSGSNNVTVATTSSQTIDGSTTKTLATQYETLRVVSDGANWLTV